MGVWDSNSYWEAVIQGNLPLVKYYLEYLPITIDLKSSVEELRNEDEETTLHIAAKNGHDKMLRHFFEEVGVDKNPKDNKGRTPLHNAVREGFLQLTIYILSISDDIEVAAKNGFTALHYAAKQGDIQIIKALVDGGAIVDATSNYGTPLRVAAVYKRRDAVKFLLDCKASPCLGSPDSSTTLLDMIITKSFDSLKLLLEGRANPNHSSCGVTPLCQAATEGMPEIINCLLQFGADPNVADSSGAKPLEWAALYNNGDALKILFPVTNPIMDYSVWSIDGIIKKVHSEEDRKKRALVEMIITFQEKAWFGHEALQRKDFGKAYTFSKGAIHVVESLPHLIRNFEKCYQPSPVPTTTKHLMKGLAFRIVKSGKMPLEYAVLHRDEALNFLFPKTYPTKDLSCTIGGAMRRIHPNKPKLRGEHGLLLWD